MYLPEVRKIGENGLLPPNKAAKKQHFRKIGVVLQRQIVRSVFLSQTYG
jgi:hypothetical protein